MMISLHLFLQRHLLKLALVSIVVIGGYTLLKKETIPDIPFSDLQGRQITAYDLRGKVVILNFWQTTCPYCVGEMPDLARTHAKYEERDFELIAISMLERSSVVRNFTKGHQLPFTVALDVRGKLADAVGAKATPTMLILDKKGHIIKRYVGVPNFSDVHHLLEELLDA